MEFMHILHYLSQAHQAAIDAKQDSLAYDITTLMHETTETMMKEQGWVHAK